MDFDATIVDPDTGELNIYAGAAYTDEQLVWVDEDYHGDVIDAAVIKCRFIPRAQFDRAGSSAAAELELTGAADLTLVVDEPIPLTLAFAASAAETATLTTTFPPSPSPTHRVQVWSGTTLLVDVDCTVRRRIEAA